MATSISDITNSTSLDGLMKNVYLPTMQTIAYDDTSFSDMIKSRTDVVTGGGNQIVHFSTLQRAEGVGAFGEGGDFVTNVPVKGKQQNENVKFLNAYIALTGPVIKAANEGKKAAIDIVTQSFSSNMRAFKNDIDRQFMGDGSGRLARVSAIDTGTSKMTVTQTSFPLAPFNADMFMPQGTRFGCATFDASGIDSSGPANSGSGTFGFIVSNVDSRDLSAGTAILSITDSSGGAYSGAGSHNIAVGDFCFRERSYYDTAAAQAYLFSVCRETNGVMNLISDGLSNSETSSNYLTEWGLTRTSFSNLQSVMTDFQNAELDEENLLSFMINLQYSRQAKPNLLLTTPSAEAKYFSQKVGDRRFNNVGPMDFVGGFTRMGIQFGSWQLILTSLAALPKGNLIVMDTNDFAFAQNADIHYTVGDGGGILQQSHTGDNKFAAMVHYVNLVCFDEYRQGKGYNVAQ